MNGVVFFGLVVFTFMQTSDAHALLLDLSATNSYGTVNNALFSRTVLHGQGTGSLIPFVRIQKNGSEKGYNTDGAVEFDTKVGTWTHSIKISDIPLVTINNVNYRELLLDAGEPSGNSLEIEILQLYLMGTGNITGYPANFPASALKYELVDGTYNGILLDNVTGNGIADLYAYIPDSAFSGTDPYLYLYTEMDLTHGTFEEWGVQGAATKDPEIPEPASLLLFGTGIFGAFIRKRLS